MTAQIDNQGLGKTKIRAWYNSTELHKTPKTPQPTKNRLNMEEIDDCIQICSIINLTVP